MSGRASDVLENIDKNLSEILKKYGETLMLPDNFEKAYRDTLAGKNFSEEEINIYKSLLVRIVRTLEKHNVGKMVISYFLADTFGSLMSLVPSEKLESYNVTLGGILEKASKLFGEDRDKILHEILNSSVSPKNIDFINEYWEKILENVKEIYDSLGVEFARGFTGSIFNKEEENIDPSERYNRIVKRKEFLIRNKRYFKNILEKLSEVTWAMGAPMYYLLKFFEIPILNSEKKRKILESFEKLNRRDLFDILMYMTAAARDYQESEESFNKYIEKIEKMLEKISA